MKSGDRVSHYRLISEIGKGGMGVVWRAEDTVLHRTVAVKFLSAEMIGDPTRLARFEREARVLASLNHPHVSAIHGLEKDAGHTFLVLEHVDGETLQERLARGTLSIEEVLKLGSQMARGIAAAHERGVLHRDLKPGNIKVTPEGQIKVLDFGLAKALNEHEQGVDPGELETTFRTAQHIVLGTAPYMSPEQASGSPGVDRRTDVWAFGCVLYEMLSGHRAFQGSTISETLTALHREDPDWSRLPERTPIRIKNLLRRCFEKDPDRRLRDVSDARLEIDDALERREWMEDESTDSKAVVRSGRPWVAAVAMVACLVLGVMTGMAIHRFLMPARQDGSVTDVVRFMVPVPKTNGRPYSAQVSPDGRQIVYSVLGRTVEDEHVPNRLFLHSIERNEAVIVTGSDQVVPNGFAFSPDSRWLAFAVHVTEPASRTFIYKVSSTGDTSPILLAAPEEGLSQFGHSLVWLADDRLVGLLGSPRYGKPSTKLLTIVPDGVTPFEVVPLDQTGIDAGVNDLSPLTGRRVLTRSTRGCIGCPVDLDTTTGRATLFEGLPHTADASWSPTGHLLFSRPDHEGDSLVAIAYDREQLDFSGGSIVLSEQPDPRGRFHLSRGGHLSLLHDMRRPRSVDLVMVSPDGTPEPFLVQDRLDIVYVRVSGDGNMLAVTVRKGYGEVAHEVWVSEMDEPSALRRVGTLPGLDCDYAQISYTGRYIAAPCVDWSGNRDDEGVYLWTTDGARSGELVLAGNSGGVTIAGFTPDDRWLLAWEKNQGRVLVPVRADAEGTRHPVPLDVPEGLATLSPDGHWATRGGNRLFIHRFHEDGSIGDGTRAPFSPRAWLWQKRTAGNGIVYLDAEGRFFQVDVVDGAVATFSDPRPYFENKPAEMEYLPFSDMATEGRLLARVLRDEETTEEQQVARIEVVLNWTESLKQQLSASP